MINLQRDGNRFSLRFDTQDPVSLVTTTTYVTIGWHDANNLQSHMSQLLMDYEIERSAFPISDEDDYIFDRHTTGEPF